MVNVVVGKTKSGRPWKSGGRKPIDKTKNVKSNWEKKMQLKQDNLSMKVWANFRDFFFERTF